MDVFELWLAFSVFEPVIVIINKLVTIFYIKVDFLRSFSMSVLSEKKRQNNLS